MIFQGGGYIFFLALKQGVGISQTLCLFPPSKDQIFSLQAISRSLYTFDSKSCYGWKK